MGKDFGGVVDKDGVLWKATKVGSYTSTPEPGVTTIWDSIVTSVKRNGPRNACGWRSVVSREMEPHGDRTFEKLVMGPYNYLTYNEFFGQIEAFGASLVSTLGLKPGDPIVLFAETSKEWMITAYGAWRQGLKVVTIYATLGEEGVMYGINQTQATCVVCDAKLLKTLAAIAPKCKQLEAVITMSAAAESGTPSGVRVHSMPELLKTNPSTVPATPPAPSDIAIIMYTSGTTGVPKGVLISHANVVAVSAGTLCEGSILMHKESLDEVAVAPLTSAVRARALSAAAASPERLSPPCLLAPLSHHPSRGGALSPPPPGRVPGLPAAGAHHGAGGRDHPLLQGAAARLWLPW
jgi:acyl-CoA synthetase (AMP-forming)/AMP-acid ligase II